MFEDRFHFCVTSYGGDNDAVDFANHLERALRDCGALLGGGTGGGG
jgi:hypothetical protein